MELRRDDSQTPGALRLPGLQKSFTRDATSRTCSPGKAAGRTRGLASCPDGASTGRFADPGCAAPARATRSFTCAAPLEMAPHYGGVAKASIFHAPGRAAGDAGH